MLRLKSASNIGLIALASAPVLIHLTIILVGVLLLNPPPEQAWAWPVPIAQWVGSGLLGEVALLVTVLMILSLAAASGAMSGPTQKLGWVTLLGYQALIFAAIWLLLPLLDKSALPWMLFALLLLLALAFGQVGRSVLSGMDSSSSRVGRFMPTDLMILLSPILAWWLSGDPLSWSDVKGHLLPSILLYPVYAYVQLLLFLAIPARILKSLGVPDVWIMICIAGCFALLHIPNPFLVIVTGAVMLVWCRHWLSGRRLWALSLVMGLSAAMVTNLLPRSVTGEMRIGPDYIEHRIEWSCEKEVEAC